MKVYVVVNDRAFVLGVYDTHDKANAMCELAIKNGEVAPWIQIVETNSVNISVAG